MYCISLSDLHIAFHGHEVLKGIDLDIAYGESLVILGESGSGKSVLTKTILGLIDPISGKVMVDGIDVKHNKSLSKNFGVLFQNCALFDSLTVYENITFNFHYRFNCNKSLAREIAASGLSLVGLSNDVLDRYPIELSGGMKKRIALARAIVSEPKIIILDEPTSGLDPIMSDVVNNIIVKCHEKLKLTVITITHDISSAFKIASKIAVLCDGKIIACQSVQDIKNTDNQYVRNFIRRDY
ncbi:ATP-binding cassette domain-containing protein [Ehrlichia ruminantium]|uniref:ATP-binding cassette domain-containing protein n=1 Tax=Ehrlichia ruminantium TaxID=779 RepID=A0AAE6QCF5_EHRRU|nr:ATP-binding cassette domain-containing protein [Ehrlichia ruminantium]QGR02145.1 ATP-binding cassette domain-containing protein [Ehrlichia ruminantium]QGR03065.1 ATP-binding cassette domain-containing protein [Ehrlichia ruminantium]QGR03990.1 ATP-binding cassette domain-containing protein [Ehrlichia ruminantium]